MTNVNNTSGTYELHNEEKEAGFPFTTQPVCESEEKFKNFCLFPQKYFNNLLYQVSLTLRLSSLE
jgi:hypothetical protein